MSEHKELILDYIRDSDFGMGYTHCPEDAKEVIEEVGERIKELIMSLNSLINLTPRDRASCDGVGVERWEEWAPVELQSILELLEEYIIQRHRLQVYRNMDPIDIKAIEKADEFINKEWEKKWTSGAKNPYTQPDLFNVASQ